MAIAFRSLTSQAYASRTNTVLTAPAGLADGDILVCVLITAKATTAPTPTPPAGFASFGTATSVTDAGSFNGRMNIFWKRAASESGSYTFTHAVASSNGVLAAYSGCLASGTPLGATANATGNDNTTTGPTITTTAANSYLLFCSHNWTATASSPPSGMTERYDGLAYLADQLIASAGATGTRVESPNGNGGSGDQWAARMVELLVASGSGSTYNDTTAETATAADTPGGLLTTTKAIAETAASAETVTSLLTVAGAVVETAAASDSVNGLVADADALAWRTAVVANGGTVSDARFTIVSDFITAEKAAGTWALTDDYWGLWAENEPEALTSLKQRRLATTVASPTFTADRGYTFNGTTNYINTGFVPSTNAVAMTNSNGRLAIYDRLNVSSNNTAAGTQTSGTVSILINPRAAALTRSRCLEAELIQVTLPVADSRGYSSISRAGTATVKTYKDGTALADGTGVTLAATLPTFSLYIGCNNAAGVAGTFRSSAVGLVCIGAPLSDAQEAAQYTDVQAWATAVGAVQIGTILEMLAANDTVAADVIPGEITPEAPTQVPGAGPPGPDDRRRFELYLLPEEDEDDEKPKRKRRLRIKKAELEEKVEAAVEYIEAGSPRPMAPQAMVAEVSTLMGLDALLEADRRRVERTIYQYLAALLEEEEEEEIVSFLLAA